MSYTTFKRELTGAPEQIYYNTIGLAEIDNNVQKLIDVRIGIIDTVLIPNKIPMDRYIMARQNYLDSTEPLVQDINGKMRKAYEWRSQLTHRSTLSSFYAFTGALSDDDVHQGTEGFTLCSVNLHLRTGTLCATEVYGDHNDRSSTLDNWTLERWQLWKKEGPSSLYWVPCGYWTGGSEKFSSIDQSKIDEIGLTTVITVTGLQASADDFYSGMKWIYETPNWEYRNLLHYNEDSSWGIEFLIYNNRLAKTTVIALNEHYNNLVTLNSRY